MTTTRASALPAEARTWKISDIDGRNKRTVTLDQYRAEIDAAKRKAEKIFADARAALAKVQS